MRAWGASAVAGLLVLGAGSAGAAIEFFQGPSDCSSNPGTPALLPTNGSPVVITICFETGGTATSAGTRCVNGNGDEICGWDLRVESSVPAVTIQSFTPNGDVVFNILNPQTFLANGGDFVDGDLTGKVGSLTLAATGSGTVDVTGTLVATADLEGVSIPGNVLAVAGGDTDGDGIEDAGDNCPVASNPGQQDTGGIGTATPDGIGNACQCGDITNNGIANGQDGTFITRHALGYNDPLFVDGGKCDVTGNAICNGQDGTFTTRAGLGHLDPLNLAPRGQNCHNADLATPACPTCLPCPLGTCS